MACDSLSWSQALRLQFIPRTHLKSQTLLPGSLTPALGPEIGRFRELTGESIWSFWINERPCLKGNKAGIGRWRHLMFGSGLCMHPLGFVQHMVLYWLPENVGSMEPGLDGEFCSVPARQRCLTAPELIFPLCLMPLPPCAIVLRCLGPLFDKIRITWNQVLWNPTVDLLTTKGVRVDILHKGLIHILDGGWGWEGVRSHHIILNDCHFKTYELVISGIFVVMILDHKLWKESKTLVKEGSLSGSGGD